MMRIYSHHVNNLEALASNCSLYSPLRHSPTNSLSVDAAHTNMRNLSFTRTSDSARIVRFAEIFSLACLPCHAMPCHRFAVY